MYTAAVRVLQQLAIPALQRGWDGNLLWRHMWRKIPFRQLKFEKRNRIRLTRMRTDMLQRVPCKIQNRNLCKETIRIHMTTTMLMDMVILCTGMKKLLQADTEAMRHVF